MSDLIDRQQAIGAVDIYLKRLCNYIGTPKDTELYALERGLLTSVKVDIGELPSAQPTFDARDTQYNLPIGTDLISRAAAIKDAESWVAIDEHEKHLQKNVIEWLKEFPPAELGTNLAEVGTDLISRQAVLDAIDEISREVDDGDGFDYAKWREYFCELPPEQPERDTPKRVLWTGWKGHRYTRYNCPNCKKPVRNDDVYCHRCGQRLMFPKVSHTPYVEGQKQEVIVRWDDE